ncbi:MAG TPA: acyclic terpene utilization AtuA family protein [Streptosporangiaceae bacterium]
MTDPAPKAGRLRILVPTGMLGGGFPAELIRDGIAAGAAAIAVDGGSTDSGPYYLGRGVAKTAAAAVERDIRILLIEARRANIPIIVGTCGTSGTDAGVDWVADMVEKTAAQHGLKLNLAKIYSEQNAATIGAALNAGRVKPLAPLGDLDRETLSSCSHIVGLMGHEPMLRALEGGADVILAGRATDTAMLSSFALLHGMPAGPTWHAAKTVECGGQCTVSDDVKATSNPIMVEIDAGGFTVIPLHPKAAATPTSVAAHMIYENANPYSLREPTGVLDTSLATYTAADDRTVRVEGSRFEPVAQTTVKLEGSRVAGYETVSLVGIADPHVLSRIDEWLSDLVEAVTGRIRDVLGLDEGSYQIDVRCYGQNAILGALAPEHGAPAEVGVLFKARAADQETATAIARLANPLLLHLPLPGMVDMPSFAFATSPAEIERGAVYEFVLNHTIDVSDGSELFRTEVAEVG